ncbi:MFS transporter [Thiomicrorhabdus xiamenensis]|uniref:MFS transporter n=1 Tax=Thiomicrorhabdus xiamenensis TaxID=2739063 RepID=A0A7D4T8Y2_9GAMM|nr:MFS transporter [Thiomicrorhabdus xiamenensis]QKI88126.1 MFS transporter [Thiomicrorhabdus xiamenensis]
MWPVFRFPAFRAFFGIQFLGAFNDNLYKNALVILITFKLSQSEEQTGLLVTLAAGLFILPFLLFSPLAGQLADAYDKRWLIRKINLAEVGVMLLGAISLIQQSIELLLFTLFLMGTQSAFFGPIKYAFLPEILPEKQLIKGNALFSGSTFVAILLGTILGGLGVMPDDGVYLMGAAVIVVASLGYLASFAVGEVRPHPGYPEKIRFWGNTRSIFQQALRHREAFFAVLGISWFWFFGAVILSQIPTLVKYGLQADDQVVVWFLTLFSIGIALGSAGIAQLFKGQVHLRWHPLLLILMSTSLLMAVWLIHLHTPVGGNFALTTLSEFLSSTYGLALSVSFALMAFFGGAYIVPLYTLMQCKTPAEQRGQMIAVNNLINSALMVLSSLLLMFGFGVGLSLLAMLVILAVANILVIVLFKMGAN